MSIQWIGIALTIIGMIFTYKPQNQPVQPQQVQTSPQQHQYGQMASNRFLCTTINIAYDTQTGKYYFQHADGQWYDNPPRPF